MSRAAYENSKPNAAEDVAKLILGYTKRPNAFEFRKDLKVQNYV